MSRLLAAFMTRFAAIVLFLCASASPAASPADPPAAPGAAPDVVDYRIEVSLDPDTKILRGNERLVWRNPSNDPVSELRFHMYLNAFRNGRTTFMRESGRQLRGDEAGHEPDDWGWIDVSSMKTDAGVDLQPKARYIQPDAAHGVADADDRTVLSVPLPSPVPPRGEITLQIAFEAKLPRIFARTGFVRDYFLVGQWFPKIGVYEPAGMRGRRTGGWNCHTFHGYSEFYADYGRFDVSINVPSRFVVGATGQRVGETKSGDRTTYRYVQDRVHDFAWTADPRFRVVEFRFDPARDIPKGWAAMAAKDLGTTEAAIALKPVAVRILMQPDHLRGSDRYVRSTKEALSYYGLWFGAYPYETLTVVDPPDDGTGSEGMEYPTFVTGGLANAFMTRWPLKKVLGIEVVVIHEIGHQWWYGMVGSNEFEESWLDEGLNDDSEARALQLAYGERDIIQLPGGVGLDSISYRHALYTRLANLDPIRRCAWCFASGQSYAVNSYMKTGLFMAQLKNDLGAGPFSRAQRAYFDEWSFRHPSTDDFFRTFERVAGRDLSTYRRLVEGTGLLDWEVVSVKSGRPLSDEGVFDRPEGRVTLEDGKVVRPARAAASEKKTEPGIYFTRVLFGNAGDWLHEARARIAFEDGTILERALPASAKWVRYEIRYKSPLAWAVVDPERRNTWDWNRLNDSKVLRSGRGEAHVLSKRATVKYTGFASWILGLWSQLAWALA
jgi:hypothetical protein